MTQVPLLRSPLASPPIHWRLAWGVVTLQTALQLGWMIYRAYQPALLTTYGFAGLLLTFSVLPGILGLVVEPIGGWISDRFDSDSRGRLLPISIAVLVAGMIFLTVASLLVRGIPAGDMLLPALLVSWMVSVQCSSSPSLALLNDSVSLQSLPRVAALVTLGHGVIGALESQISKGALRLGPGLTFSLGAVVLGIGLGILRTVPPPANRLNLRPAIGSRSQAPISLFLLLLTIGLSVGVLTSTLLSLLPRVQESHGDTIGPAVLLVSAVAAPLVGSLASRWGGRRSLIRGVIALTFVLALALVAPGSVIPLLLPGLGLILSLVATSLTAVSLATLPSDHAGLGSGLVLGSSGAAGAMLLFIHGTGGRVLLAPVLAALAVATAIALVGAALLPLEG